LIIFKRTYYKEGMQMTKLFVGTIIALTSFAHLTTQAMSPLDKIENNLMSTHGRLFKEKVVTEYMRNDELKSWYNVMTQLYEFVTERTSKFDTEIKTIWDINKDILQTLMTNYDLNIAPALLIAKTETGTKSLDGLDWRIFRASAVEKSLRDITTNLRPQLESAKNRLSTSKHFYDSKNTKDARTALLFLVEILDAVIARITNEVQKMTEYAKQKGLQ
jgi:hypothetical protein